MKNIFRRKEKLTTSTLVLEPTIKIASKNKSTKEIVEEIHETFNTEVGKLLSEAGIKNSLETDKEELISKSERLNALGFVKAKETVIAQEEITRLKMLEKENNQKNSLKRAIEHFSFHYPLQKFITEESVRKICAKYNLVYGSVGKYKGDVPEKNLQEIERFKLRKEDICLEKRYHYFHSMIAPRFEGYTNLEFHCDYAGGYQTENCSLEICAPLKDFDMKAHEIKDFKISKIEIPDPVVLQPVYFEGKKHYLILTAWGAESLDEDVVNQKMN